MVLATRSVNWSSCSRTGHVHSSAPGPARPPTSSTLWQKWERGARAVHAQRHMHGHETQQQCNSWRVQDMTFDKEHLATCSLHSGVEHAGRGGPAQKVRLLRACSSTVPRSTTKTCRVALPSTVRRSPSSYTRSRAAASTWRPQPPQLCGTKTDRPAC